MMEKVQKVLDRDYNETDNSKYYMLNTDYHFESVNDLCIVMDLDDDQWEEFHNIVDKELVKIGEKVLKEIKEVLFKAASKYFKVN